MAHTKKRIITVLALESLLIGQLCAKPSVMAPGSQFAHVAFTFQEECERKGGGGIEYLPPPTNTSLYLLGLEGETPLSVKYNSSVERR